MRVSERVKIFLNFRKIIIKNKYDLIKLAAEETGSPIKYHKSDLNSSLDYLKLLHKLKNLECKYFQYEPKGRCLIIASANQPLAVIIFTVTSALFYGNKVVLKPSRRAILTSQKIIDIFYKAGVSHSDLTLFISADKLLDKAILNKEFDVVVSFASNRVNNMIAGLCVDSGTEFIGENEGYDWVYIDDKLPYAIDIITEELVTGIIKHNGQMCDSVRGIIVNKKIYEKVKSLLVEKLNKVIISSPLDKRSDLGILLKKTENFSENYFHNTHINSNSKILINRGILKLVEVNRLTDLVCANGPFSPIAWLYSSKNIDEVVDKWNKVNNFGLGFSIYSSNKKIQNYFIKNIKAGRISINKEHTKIDCFDPWGGVKKSGFGGAIYWFERFTNRKFVIYGKK